MAGTAKDIQATEIHQGPGDMWVVGTAPVDATPRLTLASDGTPDSVTHGVCTHLGATSEVTTTIKPKINMLDMDAFDGPFDVFMGDISATLEATFAQLKMAKLSRALGVGTYSTGAGYEALTFGGNLVVPTFCLAAISASKDNALRHIVSVLFTATATGGFQVIFGRNQPSQYKCSFLGLADLSRAAGKQVGNIYRTLADAAGGTPTAKAFTVNEAQQGPGDLWLIGTAPTDAAQRLALDAATLTPDSVTHAGSKHLGATAGPITVTVQPKIAEGRIDQADSPLYVFVDSIEAKIECELTQSAAEKVARALGVGSFSTQAGSYEQVTFGGVDQPTPFCIAAIAKKRSDPTKAFAATLYRVMPTEGISIAYSRKKPGHYKFSATGLIDPTRTAGRQMGVIQEMV